MKRSRLRTVALIAPALTLLLCLSGSTARAFPEAKKTIPKAWGTLKGGVGLVLIFEDADGTIRLVDEDGVAHATLERR